MSADTAKGRRSGAAGAALDVLLTDAAVGNPASRVLKEPAGIVRAGVKVATARFVARNVHDLLAPTNFPWSNPAVLKETLDQGGANLVKGLRRAGRDIAARRLPAMVDTSRFEVGGNLALSEGSVVLRTEVFELIQYKPKTATVHEIPLLIIPPTINKYYILDLAPGRSIVEYLVAQGQQVFVISWRNPGQAEGDFDFDTYAAAIAEARSAVAAIAKRSAINLAAACSRDRPAAARLREPSATPPVAALALPELALAHSE